MTNAQQKARILRNIQRLPPDQRPNLEQIGVVESAEIIAMARKLKDSGPQPEREEIDD